MKKVTLLLFVATAVFYCSSLNGQTAFGLKGGVNISTLTENSYKPRIGGHGGLFVNRSITKNFRIQPELLYSGEGLKLMDNNTEHRWALHYIQIPLMLQFYPISQVYIEAGPQVGFLVGAQDKVTGGLQKDFSGMISSVEYAIGAGLGIKATDRISLYGRYNFGLNDITSYDKIIHNSKVIQIGISARLYNIK